MRTLGMLLLLSLCATFSWAEVPPLDHQIAGAVLAAPEEMRAGATVLGFNVDYELVTLREGTNELVCLASDHRRNNFNVACYHRDLNPFMARGRELTAQGVTGQQRHDIRYKEIEEGQLAMPKEPTTLYVLTGSSFNPTTKVVEKSYLRWVVYIPYATEKSTGMSTKPATGSPWLMFPGTPGAHIMMSPPRDQ